MILFSLAALLAASSAPPPSPPPPLPPGSYAINATSADVRRTPSLPGPVILEAKGDTLFHIVRCDSEWCELDLGWRAGRGYLPRGQLQPVPPPPRVPS